MRDRLPIILSATALLVAVLGATPIGEAAYDAVVPKNSVGTAQLKNNAVTVSKIRKGAVTNVKLRGDAVDSGKVKNRSLKAIDFALGQLPAGAAGDKGEKGEKGDKGDTGPRGPSWGDASGPGFGLSAEPLTAQGFSVKLPIRVGGKVAQKFLVLGRLDLRIICKSSGPCSRSYYLMVGGKPVQGTNVTFLAKAGETTNDSKAVFGVATVGAVAPRGGKEPEVSWGYQKNPVNPNIQETTAGTYVGAIELGS